MCDEKTVNQQKKASSVRHTRAVQRDRSKRPVVDPPAAQVAERLNEIVKPATLSQVAHFHQQGLRERTLTLPGMVAFVLSLVWRQLGGVSELARLVQTEALLWTEPVKVSQQGVDFVGYSRDEMTQEVAVIGRVMRVQFSKGEFAGVVNRHKQIQLAFFRLDFGDVEVKIADGIRLGTAFLRPFVGHLR